MLTHSLAQKPALHALGLILSTASIIFRWLSAAFREACQALEPQESLSSREKQDTKYASGTF